MPGDNRSVMRAKGILMAKDGITEDQAHKKIQQAAMCLGLRIVDMARAIELLAEADWKEKEDDI